MCQIIKDNNKLIIFKITKFIIYIVLYPVMMIISKKRMRGKKSIQFYSIPSQDNT